VNGVSFGTAQTAGAQLTGNSPGTSADGAFATDAKFTVSNTTASALAVTVSFAQNNFTTPAGSPLTASATQTLQTVGTNPTAVTQVFTGYGDGTTNSLVPGTGAAVATPNCTVAASPPQHSCAQDSSLVSFARSGNFALSGIESFTLGAGDTVNAQGSVSAFAPVPEPATLFLLGSGLVGVATRYRRRRTNA